MIQINKPKLNKAGLSISLKKKLKVAISKLKKDYLANQAEYDSGKKTFSFSTNLYKGDKEKEIKEALLKIQDYKCCYCEQEINGYVDVEHFRPKNTYLKTEKDGKNYPSYYWLAYDWDNLFMACEVCNSSYKKSLFPLLDESTRSKNHLGKIENEKPLLVHPTNEKPEDFITFKNFLAQGVDEQERGKKVIEFFALNKNRKSKETESYLDNLRDNREAYLKMVSKTVLIANLEPSLEITKQDIEEAKELLLQLKKGKFAGMIRANFPKI